MIEKYALFEVGTTNIRLSLCQGVVGESFHIYKTLSEYVHINQHIEADGMIKSAKFHECTTILRMYKKICESDGVKNFIAVAAESLVSAKNYRSFIDELSLCIGTEFKFLNAEQEANAIYTAVVNTLDLARGVIVNVSSFSTRIIHYSRRMILDSVTIPYGSASLYEKAGGDFSVATSMFKKELDEHAPFLKSLDPETQIVGEGGVFTSIGRLSRKIKKYPIDIDHNYVMDNADFKQAYDFLKGLDVDKRQKLRGISSQNVQTLLCGMCIIDVLFRQTGLENLVTATSYRNVGVLFNHMIPYTVEKPISDLLSYSFGVIADVANLDKERARRHHDLSVMLFKQIRVLHKLPRTYVKALNIASNLYCLAPFGENFHAIMSAPIHGATHKDILLAAFAASFKRWEDFNLSEWLKYKDVVTDEDLDAVRKIAMVLALAESFDIRGSEIVKDITCDLLGDSVIIKLITTTDQRAQKVDVSAADVEIFHAKKFSTEFQKTFKRSLELI